jgi:glycosyltransferase involved in cell wall biosynthesis
LGRYDPEDSASADPEIVDTALKEGIVEHWGEADDVRPLIAKADCVVLPSYYREGTPRSLLEAAAMGKPLVAADSIGTREPVSVGVNGFLHKPRDSADLAEKLLTIRALSAEDIEAMGAASRRIMIERFEERIVLNAYLDAITRYRKERQGNK